MTPALRASGLTVRRGGRPILTGVELAVAPGELVRISGANGSGKSTLLRVLAGIAAPAAGRVERPASCTFLPEKLLLTDALRVGEWLATLRALRGASRTVPAAALRDAGLPEDVAGLPAGRLSKGMLQKVGLVDAFESEPALLLLDEPLAGLDGPARAWFGRRLRERLAAGVAAVVVDHVGEAAPGARHLTISGSELREP